MASDALFPNPAAIPAPGTLDLRALSTTVLQLRNVAGRTGWDKPPTHWAALENKDFTITPPDVREFLVRVNGREVAPVGIGFRREPIFADYYNFDLRLLNSLFFILPETLRQGDRIEVIDRSARLWLTDRPVKTEFHATRYSPCIHINHAGYAPGFMKRVFVSGDLGTLGELKIPGGTKARLIDTQGNVVFEAHLAHRKETDWKWHQQVWSFDFTSVDKPGEYRIEVDGLGQSAPVRIHDAAFAAAARLHALGTLHQRSGFEKKLPFTRIEHAASHTAPAEIPTTDEKFKATNRHIARMVSKNTPDEQNDPKRQVAPPLKDVSASLFPFVNQGTVDVSGGHYDAGDYSKYMTNSATLVGSLIFAADNFPGVDRIDNLGIPESGDGIPDAIQIAKWESDFIVKMQDADGGFYFLVYPRDRPYELDVLPENGDPQVVFPKTIVSTAAAVGALAQCAASPVFRKYYPTEAKRYLAAATKGYEFLLSAIAKHGIQGSFQVISHYGAAHAGVDELCYAAASMFAATGDAACEKLLMELWPDPTSAQSMRWGWWPLAGAYGEAARVYAFLEQKGNLPPGKCHPEYLAKMRKAIEASGDTLQKLAEENAFGIPLSLASKRSARVGWFWAMEFAFDFASAHQVTTDDARRARFLETILSCASFEFGANPSNRVFVSGAGPTWRRQIVNRISLNDSRKIAISGIAVGNVVSTPDNIPTYKIAGAAGLRRMYWPTLAEFPFYDRAGLDAYNVRAECVTASTAKILATYLFLMARTAEAARPWQTPQVAIVDAPESVRAGEPFTARLKLPEGLSLADATVLWEVPGSEPCCGPEFHGAVGGEGMGRLEAEIVWPDGRRAFAVHKLVIQANQSATR